MSSWPRSLDPLLLKEKAGECVPVTESGGAYLYDWIFYDHKGMALEDSSQIHVERHHALIKSEPDPSVEDLEPEFEEDAPEDISEGGPISLNQPFFLLKKTIKEELGISVKNKIEARAALIKAGRLT